MQTVYELWLIRQAENCASVEEVIGERLVEARRRAGMNQAELGAAIGGYSQSMMSHIEAGRTPLRFERAVEVARELGVSLDWLTGLTDDPTPAAELAERSSGGKRLARLYLTWRHPGFFGEPELADDQRRMQELDREVETVASELMALHREADHAILALHSTTARAGVDDDGEHVDVLEVAPAAGSGTVVEGERVIGRTKFRRAWLQRQCLVAEDCRVLGVVGESMEPTLPDGCSILVSRAPRPRRAGRIYVVRTEDGLIVKRAGKDEAGRWRLESDHPAWPPLPWPPPAELVGEVRWVARTL